MSKGLALVTGASGYLGLHCVKALLNEGYQVRGSVRSLKVSNKVDPVRALASAPQLELIEADLTDESSWKSAVKNCDYVLHVASILKARMNDDDVNTAVNGTRAVLKAAADEPSVKKIVLTSSIAAINRGHGGDRVFDERDWSDLKASDLGTYEKSKTVAEKTAWDYVRSLPKERKLALTVINPPFITGPLLSSEQGGSAQLVGVFLNHKLPAVPHIYNGFIDVRDLALAHVQALSRPETDGERIIVCARAMWWEEMAEILQKEFGPFGYNVPTRTMPSLLISFLALFNGEVAMFKARQGIEARLSNEKAKRLLNIAYRDPSVSLVEMGHSLIEKGIIEKKKDYVPLTTRL